MVSFIATGWAGVLVGVSFIATPAKFRAVESSTAQLLEVGRVTFNTLMVVECFLLPTLIIAIWLQARTLLLLKALMPGFLILIAVQYLVLLPMLDMRVDSILNGVTPDSSNAHIAYIFIELSKISILVAIGRVAPIQRDKEPYGAIH